MGTHLTSPSGEVLFLPPRRVGGRGRVAEQQDMAGPRDANRAMHLRSNDVPASRGENRFAADRQTR